METKIIQLVDPDGCPLGLYSTKREDNLDLIEHDIKLALEFAIEREKYYLEPEHYMKIDVQEEMDMFLKEKNITRVFTEEVEINHFF